MEEETSKSDVGVSGKLNGSAANITRTTTPSPSFWGLIQEHPYILVAVAVVILVLVVGLVAFIYFYRKKRTAGPKATTRSKKKSKKRKGVKPGMDADVTSDPGHQDEPVMDPNSSSLATATTGDSTEGSLAGFGTDQERQVTECKANLDGPIVGQSQLNEDTNRSGRAPSSWNGSGLSPTAGSGKLVENSPSVMDLSVAVQPLAESNQSSAPRMNGPDDCLPL